jgi:hypothetical protein
MRWKLGGNILHMWKLGVRAITNDISRQLVQQRNPFDVWLTFLNDFAFGKHFIKKISLIFWFGFPPWKLFFEIRYAGV